MTSSLKTTISLAVQHGERELLDLRGKSFQELGVAQPSATRELGGLPRRASLTTYVDHLNGELQVAVQVIAYGWLGYSRVWAQGFRVRQDGSRRDLLDSELWEYT